MLEELLSKYDLAHSSIISGGKVNFNINFLLDNKVYISINNLINNIEKKSPFDFSNNENFINFDLPKIFQRFISKNPSLNIRKIMANDSQGTIVLERKDGKDSLVVRNCTIKIMILIDKLLSSYNNISNVDKTKQDAILFTESSYNYFNNYIKYNIIFDYANYRVSYFKSTNNKVIETNVKKAFDDNETNNDSNDLLILNIARYAYTFNTLNNNIWDEIIEKYKDNEKVIEICNIFKNEKFEEYTIYNKSLLLAEYEKDNDILLNNEELAVEEALEACNKNINYFDDSYLKWWDEKQEHYSSILDRAREAICLEFKDSYGVNNRKNKEDGNMEKEDKKESLISKFKEIKRQKESFANIINDPIVGDSVEDEVEKIFLDVNNEKIKLDAEDQAKKLIQVEEERNQLKKDAEEFAKIILKNEKEYKKIIAASEEQARKIIDLEKENEKLKVLAEDNAKYILEKQKQMSEEERLREYINNSPVKSQDIDKINNLLNALSEVKGIDFTVNHPTTMQEVLFLEEKIITYLTTHKNIVHDEDTIVPIEKEEMKESKSVIELLSMIRNAYVSSHFFEKDGRHTLIEVNPVDEDTYRVTLYSVKDDSEDVLMDAFFEEYQLTIDVLKEICDIFSTDAVIVASKIDNIPPDKADYLVIDNMDNAIKFMDFKRETIEKIKEFL